MSNAFSGVGTTFYLNSSSIAEINSITGPNLTRDTIDVTSLDSTGGYREFIASFRDGGEVTLNMNFTEAGYILLKTEFETETSDAFDIVLDENGSNQTTFSFDGLITSLGLAVPMDDKVTSDVTIKITGQVTVDSGFGV